MKKRMTLAIFGCMPLVAAADIMGQSFGFTDVSTPAVIVLGVVALVATRRFQKG